MRHWSIFLIAFSHFSCSVSASPPGTDANSHVNATDNYPAGIYFHHLLKEWNAARSDHQIEKRQSKEDREQARKEREKARKERDAFYLLKLHDDDDYAKWAKDPKLKRGLHESRVIREVIWGKPDEPIADFGVGIGKLWRADSDGFIHDISDRLADMSPEDLQKIGAAPRHNIRLPPRPQAADSPPSYTDDPTQTMDSPSPRKTGATATENANDSTAQTTTSSSSISQTTDPTSTTTEIAKDLTAQTMTSSSTATLAREHARDVGHAIAPRQGIEVAALFAFFSYEPVFAVSWAALYAATAVSLALSSAVVLAGLTVFAILGGIIAMIVSLVLLLKHHPKNPEGHVHFAWDWDNIPYQYDDKYPKMDATPPSTTVDPPDGGCDTWDMADLERRSWTTTQYAMHPCPTIIPAECSKEWYMEHSGHKHITEHNHRRNPVYCWDFIYFKTTHHEEDYKAAKLHDRLGVGQFSQYSGHQLADRNDCLGDRMLDEAKCRDKYLPKMKHHNIEHKKCKDDDRLCDEQESRYLRVTTGWPKGCKEDEKMCWE